MSRDQVIVGTATVSSGVPSKLFLNFELPPSRVLLLLVGDRFDPRHYTELPAHQHNVQGTTSSAGEHAHELPPHSHGIAQHSHSVSAHTHGLPSHTHPIGSHTHSVPPHEHDIWVGSSENVGNPNHVIDLFLSSGALQAASGRVLPSPAMTTGAASGTTGAGGSGDTSAAGAATSVDGPTSTAPSLSSTSASVPAHAHAAGSLFADTVGVDGGPLSTSAKTYLDGLRVLVDGVDATDALLAATGFATLGDGTATHPLNDQDGSSPGTGLVDVSSFFTTAGIHRLDLVQDGTAGGDVHYTLIVRP